MPAALALATLVPFYWISFSRAGTGPWNDDGLYAESAQSLAKGHGYRIPSLPGDPPQTKYPILFPAVLAVIWKIYPEFPANAWALKLVPLLATLGWLLATRRLVARLAESAVGTWAAILTAATPLVITLSTYLLADTLFAMLATLALIWAHDAQASTSTGTREAIFAAVFAALAYHTKTSGTAVILSILVVLAARRKWRASLCFGGLTAALCFSWISWQLSQRISSAGVYNSWQNYRSWQVLFNFTAHEKAVIVSTNAAALMHPPVFPAAFSMGKWVLPVGLITVLSIAFTGCVVIGFVAERKLTIAHAFFVIYTVMILLWAWPPWRFLSSLLPLAIYFAASGFGWVVSGAGARKIATAGLLCMSLAGLTLQAMTTSGAGVAPTDIFHTGLNWSAMVATAERISNLTAPDAVVLTSADSAVWLYGKRKAIREMDLFSSTELIYLRTPDLAERRWRDFAAFLVQHGITHIIDGPATDEVGDIRSGCIRAIERACPGAIGPGTDLGYGYKLLRVRPTRITGITR